MFHVQKFEISPHDRFFLHGHRPCVRDIYEVCHGGVDKNLLAPPGGVDKNLLAPQWRKEEGPAGNHR